MEPTVVVLVRLEAKIDQLHATMAGRLNLVEHRVGRLESTSQWLTRTVGGGVLTLAIAALGAAWRLS